jgi:acetylornithine deacetylase/succinyl-diaminopimelate desuccinylase-like protein
MRIVPDQDPGKIFTMFKRHVESLCPRGIFLDVRLIHSGDPVAIAVNNVYIQAATEAMHEVFGKETVFVRCGGTIPIVGDFERNLKIPSVMMGFGLPDDGLHAPNEKFHIENFHQGIESLIRFFSRVGS